ncbi:MAG: hypothetical protein LBR42_01030, partial [Candidatus Methanoplasma sp.]|nr:hypothetical protein [Candidatus Methanoplasma sp.]
MEKIRAFISIRIPETPAVRSAKDRLKDVTGVSVPGEVHMTLKFLGDVDKNKIEKLSLKMRSLEKYASFNMVL